MSPKRPDPAAIADLPLDQQIAAIEQAMGKRVEVAAEGVWERVAMGGLVALLVIFLPMPWVPRLILAASAGTVVGKLWIKGSWRADEMDKQDAFVASMVSYVQDPTALPWLLERGRSAAARTQGAMWARAAGMVRERSSADDLPWLLDHAQNSPYPVREAAWQTIAAVVRTRQTTADLPWLLDHAQNSPQPVREAAWRAIATVVRTRQTTADLPWLFDHAQNSPHPVREAAWQTIADVAPAADATALTQVPRARLDWLAAEMVRQVDARLVAGVKDQERIAALIDLLADANHVPALPAMEELAKSWRPEVIRTAAHAAVAHLREVAAMNKRTETLLRPANAPAGETLLRPAGGAPDGSSDLLLRPAEQEEGR